MAEIEISINNSTDDPEKDFRVVLGNFEERRGVKVHCTVYDWEHSWSEVMKIVLYQHGPVMSQVGSTWLESLEATQGIRQFTPGEIGQLGGADVFHPVAWKSGISIENEERIVSVPWFLDTYVLYYRKDLFKKAGIDESQAFESLEALAETVQKLAAAGVTIPFALPTMVSSRANLHNLAGWVWNHGGEFISEDGKQLLLSDSRTRQGMKAYFSLYKSMPAAAQKLSSADCITAFLEGNAAITLRNAGLLYTAPRSPAFARYLDHLGVAAMPCETFIGGSNFVLWRHIRPADERLAIDLLREITSPEGQFAYFKQSGILPTRLDALKRVEEEPLYAPVMKALMTGGAFRNYRLWGLIEDRLIVAISQIWQTLYTKENVNIEEEIANVIDPLERRLQLTLSDT
jgi:ABC-type glycerol-3-phosphate transport system substrate-binding protein